MLKLGFYKKETGNFTSHKGGITQEQVDELQKLKAGDRLIIYIETNKRFETGFDANLKFLGTSDDLKRRE